MIDLCRIVGTGDDNTGIHVDRVGEYSFLMAGELGLAPEECDMILLAARIHDIGKIRIPDSILKKPGKLTREEFAVIKSHPVEGMKIIEACKSDPIVIYARDIVLTHHQ
jgi:putative two-component system response regulator